ncbi:uncharacterized protein LOC111630490 isoform X2 [Centruroides sculpturatus]|uniref:uncharacterized protein LOC111630490 isoform X2 n=1 Tax=Centruroides sculpturatus TaxID=218467 RepID=UPI000C6D076B|nr:uncharacterized protein LOC111630490 isoform X2 [Centruroides sculpturatus]
MKKLIHFLQHGRLINIDNFSVYTIASVLKKFLRKLPGGIFGQENEEELFSIINIENIDEKRERIHRLITSLPVVAQHLLVLLFGTFRAIAQAADRAQTGMSSEALGVSVAPSFFQSCVSDGKVARMEDVIRFKIATRIMKFLIDNFGVSNLFGRENYEYYARITGRILKVEEDWIFAFRYPPDTLISPISNQEECQSTPALIHSGDPMIQIEGPAPSSSLTNLGEAYTRLSVSLEENGIYQISSPSLSHLALDELKAVNRYAESTKSLTFLPQVHERQAARMRTRSEWFLNPSLCSSLIPAVDADETGSVVCKILNLDENKCPSASSSVSLNSNIPSGGIERERQLIRRTSSKEKKLVRRSSSKKQDKENGNNYTSSKHGSSHYGLPSSSGISYEGKLQTTASPKRGTSGTSSPGITEQDCTEVDVQTFHVTLTYKPRI